MNILLAADVSIKDLLGGAEKGLHEEAVFLAQKGHKVFILTRRLNSHDSDHEVINGIHEYRYDVNTNNPVAFLLSTIVNGQKLYKKLSSEIKFDVINFHQPFCAFAVHLLPGAKNTKTVYTCHSLSFEEYISRSPKINFLTSCLNVILRKAIEKFSLDKSDKIIVLSQFTKNKLIKTYRIKEDKIVVIPSGVNINHFKPPIDKNALRQEMNIAQEPLTLLTVRNLVPRMGLENLIKAVPVLQQKGIFIKLFIGGQGMLKEKLQTLIKELKLEDSVTLCGFLPDEILIKYYQTADFFILPTIELEGFGLVTIEAMACATPVLATAVGGTVEILGSFDRSFLFKGLSAQDIAELIFEKYSYYKNNPDEYKQLSINVRKFIEKNYSWETNASHVESLFRNMSI
ncbi:MAG: glycosyltransferase family 4 protein [Candidatus Omnitrophica bacterium]|nr:glycosyltransferase family 4 protein [Candidatus Omnitrophota bacterium]